MVIAGLVSKSFELLKINVAAQLGGGANGPSKRVISGIRAKPRKVCSFVWAHIWVKILE